jgi:hypothetical protein
MIRMLAIGEAGRTYSNLFDTGFKVWRIVSKARD